jgi:hypothetical protein
LPERVLRKERLLGRNPLLGVDVPGVSDSAEAAELLTPRSPSGIAMPQDGLLTVRRCLFVHEGEAPSILLSKTIRGAASSFDLSFHGFQACSRSWQLALETRSGSDGTRAVVDCDLWICAQRPRALDSGSGWNRSARQGIWRQIELGSDDDPTSRQSFVSVAR